MNFLAEPIHQLQPNAKMNAEEQVVAEEFVDELVALGVLGPPDTLSDGSLMDVVTNAPLFTVPKPGQPGQYRCIADMLKGGQNSVVGSDPVFLPRASHIIMEMCYGGYSAVFDFSKYFYNFPTSQEDRPYLGLIHPRTEEILAYYGLPMGSGNSPAIACRGGQAFLRLVRETCSLFRGTASANCWWTGFNFEARTGYDPCKGFGYILTNRHGQAVRVYGFVDDFLIHAATKQLCHEANFFMDVAFRLSMPPLEMLWSYSQCVKFLGFEFDTSGFPVLCVPLPKRERALAVVEYLLSSPRDQEFSRLSLAVSTGILQSLVEATANRIGATYLWSHYDTLHPEGAGTGLGPYCTKTPLPSQLRDELLWWQFLLRSPFGRFSRIRRSATLIPDWVTGRALVLVVPFLYLTNLYACGKASGVPWYTIFPQTGKSLKPFY